MVEHHSTQRGHQDNGAHTESSVFDKGEATTVRIPRRVFETQCHSRACGRESPLAKSPLGHLQNLTPEAEQEVQSATRNPDATARDLLDRDSEVAHHGDAAFRI